MRLDKYLKVSRIIKRRTVANEACSMGRVLEGLKIALDFIDEVIKIIRNSKDTVSAKAGLMERVGQSALPT